MSISLAGEPAAAAMTLIPPRRNVERGPIAAGPPLHCQSTPASKAGQGGLAAAHSMAASVTLLLALIGKGLLAYATASASPTAEDAGLLNGSLSV